MMFGFNQGRNSRGGAEILDGPPTGATGSPWSSPRSVDIGGPFLYLGG